MSHSSLLCLCGSVCVYAYAYCMCVCQSIEHGKPHFSRVQMYYGALRRQVKSGLQTLSAAHFWEFSAVYTRKVGLDYSAVLTVLFSLRHTYKHTHTQTQFKVVVLFGLFYTWLFIFRLYGCRSHSDRRSQKSKRNSYKKKMSSGMRVNLICAALRSEKFLLKTGFLLISSIFFYSVHMYIFHLLICILPVCLCVSLCVCVCRSLVW